MTNPGLPSPTSTKDDDDECTGHTQLKVRSYGVPILGGPLIALMQMEKFDLKFASKSVFPVLHNNRGLWQGCLWGGGLWRGRWPLPFRRPEIRAPSSVLARETAAWP